MKIIKAWGGFCDGKLEYNHIRGYDERRWSVFKTKAEARRAYVDVRPVEIIVQKEDGEDE